MLTTGCVEMKWPLTREPVITILFGSCCDRISFVTKQNELYKMTILCKVGISLGHVQKAPQNATS